MQTSILLKPTAFEGSEAVSSLATNIRLSRTAKILTFTGCHENERSTAIVLEIAKTLAGMRRVLVIDADLRTSPIEAEYTAEASPLGLTDLLTGSAKPSDVISPTNIKGLDLVTAGALVQNPAAILQSTAFDHFLELAGKIYDHVLINTPHILEATDAMLVAAASDASVLIVNCWSVSRKDLLSAKAQLEKSGKPILGTVVTKFSTGKRKKRHFPSPVFPFLRKK